METGDVRIPHCIRLANRIGLVDDLKDPKKVEMALWKIVPPEEGKRPLPSAGLSRKRCRTARTKPTARNVVWKIFCKKKGVKKRI